MSEADSIAHEVTCFDQAHAWSQDNRFLVSGYRKNFCSTSRILRSLCLRHNELMNIWTHIIGALVFVGLFVYVGLHLDAPAKILTQLRKDLHFFGPEGGENVAYSKAIEVLATHWHEIDLTDSIAQTLSPLGAFSSDLVAKSSEVYQNLLIKELALLKGVGEGFESLQKQTQEVCARVVQNIVEFARPPPGQAAVFPSAKLSALQAIFMQTTSSLPTFPISIFLMCSCFCLGCSAIFHLFTDMNELVSRKLKYLDYAGISILISGSSFAMLYYVFYCRPTTLFLYSMLIFTASLIVFTISLGPYIHEEKQATLKMALYGGLGLVNVFPFGQMIYLAFFSTFSGDLPVNVGYIYVFLSAISYLGGLYIYTHKFPERRFPKRFDIWLNSHVIWHCCVVLGALFHYGAVIQIYLTRKGLSCPV